MRGYFSIYLLHGDLIEDEELLEAAGLFIDRPPAWGFNRGWGVNGGCDYNNKQISTIRLEKIGYLWPHLPLSTLILEVVVQGIGNAEHSWIPGIPFHVSTDNYYGTLRF
jgi:hypothetical protein